MMEPSAPSKPQEKKLESQIESMFAPESVPESKKTPAKDTKSSLESQIEAMVVPASSPASTKAEKPVEPVIKPQSSHVTGDKGNPYYAKELEKAADKSSLEDSIAAMMEPRVAAPKDKNANLESQIETAIVSQGMASQSSKAPPGKGCEKAEPKAVEECIQPKSSHVTGDKGNPYYAKELEKAGKGVA